VATCLHPVLRLRIYAWCLIDIWQTGKHCPIKRIPVSSESQILTHSGHLNWTVLQPWKKCEVSNVLSHGLSTLTTLPVYPTSLKNYSNYDSTYSWITANCMLYFAHISNWKTAHFHLSMKACFLVWRPRICISISGTSSQKKIQYVLFNFSYLILCGVHGTDNRCLEELVNLPVK